MHLPFCTPPSFQQTDTTHHWVDTSNGKIFIPSRKFVNLPEDLNNNSTSAIPEYVCCVITEAIWTWFATILFSVILLLFATLKYCRKYLSKPKFDAKNLKLLKRSLIADDGDAVGKIK